MAHFIKLFQLKCYKGVCVDVCLFLSVLCVCVCEVDMIGMRTRAPKSSEGKMVNGKETLRLRSKGAATVQEVVSFTRSAGK